MATYDWDEEGYYEDDYIPTYEEGGGGDVVRVDEQGGGGDSGGGGGDSFDPAAWLDSLEQQWGVSDTPEDLAEYNRKNPEDRAQYMRDLEAQYEKRGTNIPGQDGDEDEPVSGNQPIREGRGGLQAQGNFYGGPGTQGVMQGPLQQVGQDPFSKAITGGYGDMLENYGTTADSRKMMEKLFGIIEGGGTAEDPSLYAQRFEAARQPIDSMRKAQIAGARGTLANRGLLSEPGMPQGSEIGAMGRIEEGIAPWYASAAQGLASDMAEQKQAQLSQALTLATGLSQAQAATFLQTLEGATDRQKVLSDIALATLDRNILWNQFLAQYGMDRDQALETMQMGRTEQAQTLLALFQRYVDASTGGYI